MRDRKDTAANHSWAEERYRLQERYLELTRRLLPERARQQYWSLQHDHCFMRLILDHLFEDCWYHHLDRRLVAYKQLNPQQLRQAIALAENLLDQGQPLLIRMNSRRLKWRHQA